MCIIIYSNDGKQIKEQILKNCFRNNPNGAGIMWKTKYSDKVNIIKGLMTYEQLKAAYDAIGKVRELAIHCRIATSGKINSKTCHPFPLRNTPSKMTRSRDTTNVGVMHNGVIPFCTPEGGINAKYSDTMEFTANILYPIRNELDSPVIQTLLEESTSSRLLIMRQNAETIMLGHWVQDEGLFFSNSTYKTVKAYYYFSDFRNSNWKMESRNEEALDYYTTWLDKYYKSKEKKNLDLVEKLEYELTLCVKTEMKKEIKKQHERCYLDYDDVRDAIESELLDIEELFGNQEIKVIDQISDDYPNKVIYYLDKKPEGIDTLCSLFIPTVKIIDLRSTSQNL